jgi:hypothetical protein
MSCETCGTDCRCCSGISAETPVEITNRPGLDAISYRIGMHSDFRDTLLARISAAGWKPLRDLRTRDTDDFTIALLDAFATMGDVLTFYQERIANESYLRTATERRSLIELARLIGYELRPGVAASTDLAFTIDDAPGAFGQALSISSNTPTAPEAPPPVAIPARTAVQSIPPPGEAPQIFESVEDLEAHVEWNAMRPRLTLRQTITTDMTTLWISGVDHNLHVADQLLIVPTSATATLRVISGVTTDAAADLTKLDLVPIASTSSVSTTATGAGTGTRQRGNIYSYRAQGDLTDTLLDDIFQYDWSEEELNALAITNGWNRNDFRRSRRQPVHTPNPPQQIDVPQGPTGVFVMRKHGNVFGYNAPNWGTLPLIARYPQPTGNASPATTATTPPFPTSWEGRTLEQDSEATSLGRRKIDLDHVYDEVTNGWIVLEQAGQTARPIAVEKTEEVGRSGYTISGRVTRVDAITPSFGSFTVRETVVLLQSESLPVADVPDDSVVHDQPIILEAAYTGLRKGQRVIITGERSDLAGKIESETNTLREITSTNDGRGPRTTITLQSALARSYKRPTVTIAGNVSHATHGQTVDEIAGSGDAAQPFQTFVLKQPPLTYIGAENETGGATTLEVRVNGALWNEVTSFFDHGPDERIYITRLDDDSNTTVMFGDGVTGSRLPTGTNNVTLRYRRGIGVAGMVGPTRLSQLLKPITGVKGVTNPIEATGAADADQIEDIRRNATLTAFTLGRVVSLQDYEDYARAYLGIAKASARWAWSGETRSIIVTVAGPGGEVIASNSDLAKRLRTSMQTFGDPHVPISIVPAAQRLFALSANVRVDPALVKETVFAAAKQTVIDKFSFDGRDFGQPVSLSEVYAVLAGVPGVLAADVRAFYAIGDTTATATTVRPRIGALPETASSPARILTIALTSVLIGEMR